MFSELPESFLVSKFPIPGPLPGTLRKISHRHVLQEHGVRVKDTFTAISTTEHLQGIGVGYSENIRDWL